MFNRQTCAAGVGPSWADEPPPQTRGRWPLAWWRALARFALVTLAGMSAACAQLPAQQERKASSAYPDVASTKLARVVAASAPGPRASGFRLIQSGEEAFEYRLALIDHAQKSLDLQYYIVDNDESVRKIVIRLLAAARRGVRVRLLLDDMNTVGSDGVLHLLARQRNIEVRLFNPFPAGRSSLVTRFLASATDIGRLSRRMHNKAFIADNTFAIVGGRNLGDPYFVQSTESNFVDLDVLAAGPVVRGLSSSFDRYWNHPLAYPAQLIADENAKEEFKEPDRDFDPNLAAYSFPPLGRALQQGKIDLEWAPARVLVDKPEKLTNEIEDLAAHEHIADNIEQLLNNAKQEVLIVSPYLVPGEDGMQVLRALRERGVKVRILTNSLAATDAPIVHVGYSRYREAMLKAGIELYEWSPKLSAKTRQRGAFKSFGASRASLHAKVIVVDRRTLFIGSLNFDPRSLYENTENGLIVRSPALAAEVGKMVDARLPDDSYRLSLTEQGQIRWTIGAQGRTEVFESDPDASAWMSLQLLLLRPFAPDHLL